MAIITLVAAKGLFLQEVPGSATIQPGHWQRLEGSALHGPAGRLQLHVHNSDQVATLKSLLHERACQAGADRVAIDVQTEGQSFAGRGARSRAGLPAAPRSA